MSRGDVTFMSSNSNSDKRETDAKASFHFRSNRFFQNGGRWYFETREGTVEGPFTEKTDAERHLEAYIRIERLGILSPDCGLSLEPKIDGR